MPVLTEPLRPTEFLLSSLSAAADTVVIAAAAPALPAGQVLGKVTATGKYVAYNNAATDGSEVAAGILYAAVPDRAVDQKATALTRRAEVKAEGLMGLDAPGRADLAALFIVVR